MYKTKIHPNIFRYIYQHISYRAVGRFQIVGGSTRKKGTYEVGTYLRFSCDRPWQRWLFQVLQMSKKSLSKFYFVKEKVKSKTQRNMLKVCVATDIFTTRCWGICSWLNYQNMFNLASFFLQNFYETPNASLCAFNIMQWLSRLCVIVQRR